MRNRPAGQDGSDAGRPTSVSHSSHGPSLAQEVKSLSLREKGRRREAHGRLGIKSHRRRREETCEFLGLGPTNESGENEVKTSVSSLGGNDALLSPASSLFSLSSPYKDQ